MDPQLEPPWQMASRRVKACISCTRAKRQCDKNFPSCQRCLDRELYCQYSAKRPYSRLKARRLGYTVLDNSSATSADGLHTSTSTDFSSQNAVGVKIWGSNADIPLSPSTLGLADTQFNVIDTFQPSRGSFLSSQNETLVNSPSAGPAHPSIHQSKLETFVKFVRKWMYQWVEETHCAFIHRELFAEMGLPAYLQDAYASLTTYAAKNTKNQRVGLQLVEDRANALVNEHQLLYPGSVCNFSIPIPILSTLEQLARVQALLIYQLIRLFDGDIRQRAQAERHIIILKEWILQLGQAGNLEGTSESMLYNSNSLAQELDIDRQTTARCWQDWIQSESIRRTWIVGNYVQSIYSIFHDGQTVCLDTPHSLYEVVSGRHLRLQHGTCL
ncbi:uncharacterized protein TrAtP1_009153 [Trichoderma atroviride]|uniref:uncharacterized protein n=1 Tax=Hypocrea atroviridis TaxID=63577 RepID=UPI00332302DC|nr:hypothetical protein TrAtP1_009153 [Trichoderma atroviride]